MGFTPFPLQKLGFDQTSNAVATNGLPTGGAENQVLAKNSATNFDTKWVDPAGGSSLSPSYKLTYREDSVTIYSGINSSSDSAADTNWSVLKIVDDTSPESKRSVYTATGAFTDPTALSYTLSKTYSI